MESLGFFIDTGSGAAEEQEVPVEEVEVKEKDDVLGRKESLKAEKLKKQKETEKNLAKFLFGATVGSPDEGVGASEAEESNSSSDSDESDLEDGNMDEPEDEEEGRVNFVIDGVAADDIPVDVNKDEEDSSTEQPSAEASKEGDLVPEDEFGKRLQMKARGKKRRAAWHDNADDDIEVKDVTATYRVAKGKHGKKETSTELYSKALERKFKSVVGEPAWASLDRKKKADADSDDSDDEFFRENTDVLERGGRKQLRGKFGELPSRILEYAKIRDLNHQSFAEGAVIKATEFHPTSTVGLVAGLNGTATLFQVDGRTNPKIQTVNFKNFPVKTAHFTPDGKQFIVGSQHHSYFHVYDMIAGKISKIFWSRSTEEPFNSQKFEISPDGSLIAFHGRLGSIHLFSGRTKEYLRTLKMNQTCQAVKFSKSGDLLYSHGEGGEVYIWDIRSSVCSHKFTDEGCIDGSALAVNSSYLATGSSEGVVNIYNLNSLKTGSTHPKPDKAVLNLSTQINQLSFNPTGEILAISSEMKESAVRLLHFPTMSVFTNFPPANKNLHRINSASWSPGSGYFAMGNNRGAALLFRMKHFLEY